VVRQVDTPASASAFAPLAAADGKGARA